MPLAFWTLFAQWVLPALVGGGMQYLGTRKQAGAVRHGAELQAAGTQRALDYEIEEDKYTRERDEEQRARDWRRGTVQASGPWLCRRPALIR